MSQTFLSHHGSQIVNRPNPSTESCSCISKTQPNPMPYNVSHSSTGVPFQLSDPQRGSPNEFEKSSKKVFRPYPLSYPSWKP